MADLTQTVDSRRQWLIYSREHNAWWGPHYAGYFMDIESAGRYTKAEAERVCADACRGRTEWSDTGDPEFAMLAPEFAPALLSAAEENARMRAVLEGFAELECCIQTHPQQYADGNCLHCKAKAALTGSRT